MFLRHSLLLTGTLALAATAFAQNPATEQPLPPAPPRADAPGSPINPQQGATPAPAATPVATPAAPAALRELNFAEADADGDKKVTLTEFSNYVGSRAANHSTEPLTEEVIERFRRLDQNHDAALTETEASANPPPQPQSLAPTPPPRR